MSLKWTGATTDDVDVYRNGMLITATPNSGSYTENIGQRGHATYTYLVCEEATSTCSNEGTVVFD